MSKLKKRRLTLLGSESKSSFDRLSNIAAALSAPVPVDARSQSTLKLEASQSP